MHANALADQPSFAAGCCVAALPAAAANVECLEGGTFTGGANGVEDTRTAFNDAVATAAAAAADDDDDDNADDTDAAAVADGAAAADGSVDGDCANVKAERCLISVPGVEQIEDARIAGGAASGLSAIGASVTTLPATAGASDAACCEEIAGSRGEARELAGAGESRLRCCCCMCSSSLERAILRNGNMPAAETRERGGREFEQGGRKYCGNNDLKYEK